MSLREELKRPETLILTGYGALVFALLVPRLFGPSGPEWVDRLDGLYGFFMGVAIGAFLLGIWKKKHQRAG
jgi:hypothetical protein